MGIRGLFSYIQNYVDSALQWHKLCCCKLVIDGNNLAYELFNNSVGINSAFGGDYDKYAEFVEHFFKKLIQCNVEPYIIMDGGHPVNREKFKTVYSRLYNQILISLHVDPDRQRAMKVFPLLARSVFVGVAQRLGIVVLQADFEADDEIVVLARQLNAFVLSNDSDFYLFDVPFILLNSVNFKSVQKETKKNGEVSKFIPCYRFDADQFSQITNVREELLPILAPILGNDFISPTLLKKFYLDISFLRPNGKGITGRHKTIISVIKWLSTEKGTPLVILNKVIQSVCGTCPSKKRRSMEAAFYMYFPSKSPLKAWVMPHNPTCPVLMNKTNDNLTRNAIIPNRLELELKCTCPQRRKTTILWGRQLPDWFILAFRMHLIPSTVSDILNKRYIFTLPQVEVSRRKSVYLPFEPIIKQIRGLLWTMASLSIKIKPPKSDGINKTKQNDDNEAHSLPNKGFFMSLLKKNKHESIKKHRSSLRRRASDSESNSEYETSDSSEDLDFPQISHDEDECNRIYDGLYEKPQSSCEAPLLPQFSEVTVISVTKKGDFNGDSLPQPFNENSMITRENEPVEDSLSPPFTEVTMRMQDGESNPSSLSHPFTMIYPTKEDNYNEDSLSPSLQEATLVEQESKFIEDSPPSVFNEVSIGTRDGESTKDDDFGDSVDEHDVCPLAKSRETKADFKDPIQSDVQNETDEEDGDFIVQKDILQTSHQSEQLRESFKHSDDDDDEDYEDEDYYELSIEDHASERELIKENVNFKQSKETKHIPSLKWYIRKGEILWGMELCREPIDMYKNLPSLFEIDKLTLSERKKIFYQIIDLELELEEKDLPLNIEFIMLCISFWRITYYENNVDHDTLLSFLMCVIMFSVIDSKLGRKRSKYYFNLLESTTEKVAAYAKSKDYSDPSAMSLASLIENLTADECRLANLSLFQFHTMNPAENRKSFNRKAVHAFSEYQACIYFLQFINSLLFFPFPLITVDSFWSGTFCYNIRRVFSRGGDLGVVLSSIFNGNERFIHLFAKLYNLLQVPLKLPKIKRPIGSKSSKAQKKKLGIKNPSKLAGIVQKPKPEESLPPAPEVDFIEHPTEEDFLIMAENKFAALMLR